MYMYCVYKAMYIVKIMHGQDIVSIFSSYLFLKVVAISPSLKINIRKFSMWMRFLCASGISERLSVHAIAFCDQFSTSIIQIHCLYQLDLS
jgi:hypothetical protein